MKVQLEQDIAAMCFYCSQRNIQDQGDFLGGLAFSQELHYLALPRRQLGQLGRGWANAPPPPVTVDEEIGNSRGEDALVALQGLDSGRQVCGAVGLKDPSAHTRVQTVSDHLLGVDVGKNQYFLRGIAS